MIKIRFNKTTSPASKKHYICQTRHGSWMIGTEEPDPLDPSGKATCICGGSCLEEPFKSLEWDDGSEPREITQCDVKVVNGQLVSVPASKFMMDSWSSYFPTKKSLVEALGQMGYKQGPRKGWHCWEIVGV